jgi:hypothetical protein
MNLNAKSKKDLRRDEKHLRQEKRRQKNVESVYPQEMIDDNISVISMDTTICNTDEGHLITSSGNFNTTCVERRIKRQAEESRLRKPISSPEINVSDKFDAGLLYAKNLELKEINSKLEKKVSDYKNKLRRYDADVEKSSRLQCYSKALCELTSDYERIKKENEILNNKLNDYLNINSKNNSLVDSIFKIKKINDEYAYKLPIPYPKDNRKIVVDKITQIVGNDAILTECRTSAIGFNKHKIKVGDIVLLDMTECYKKIIIHTFSESEKWTIVNLPTAEYRKANPGSPTVQVTDINSFGMIKELYKHLIS